MLINFCVFLMDFKYIYMTITLDNIVSSFLPSIGSLFGLNVLTTPNDDATIGSLSCEVS